MGLVQKLRDRQAKRQALAVGGTYNPLITVEKGALPVGLALLYPVIKLLIQRAGIEVSDQNLPEYILLAYAGLRMGGNWLKHVLIPRLSKHK